MDTIKGLPEYAKDTGAYLALDSVLKKKVNSDIKTAAVVAGSSWVYTTI